MSRSIELSDDIYEQLEAEASAAGTTPEEWIAARLPKHCAECNESAQAPSTPSDQNPASGAGESSGNDASAPPKTLAERMAGRIGRISSGRTDGSERVSEIFLEGLLEKKRTGHL